jgi:lysophospholipase L1-like esterase
MNKRNRFVVLFSIAVVLALLAACGSPEPTATTVPTSEPPVIPADTPLAPAEADAAITVTFEGDKCVFRGPERVPAGEISIVLDVRDQTAHESYGVQTLTLDEGYTLDELVPYQQEISFPLWAHDHGFIEAAQGSTQARTIVLFEGPLFLTCFTNTADETQPEYIGISGPIEIEPAAVPRAQNAATAVAESGETSWDMVVLGDSLVAGDYSVLPEAYAARIEEDLGVEVEIQNLAVGGETTQSLLTNVQKYPWYREPLQEAEVILISVGGGDLPCMEKRFFGGESGDCGGADNQDCLRQQLEEAQANWDALLAEIVSLADPREVLIRPIIPGIMEYYARVYKDQPEDVEAYNSYVVAMYEHMARSCAERGIPVLDLYALYDGPDADPSLPEIGGTGDGVHVSDEGDAVIADLLHELGYDSIAPAEANAGITVTFEGDQCIYHGPERVPAGEIPIVLDARDQTAHELYGVQTLTMDEGHTLEELVPYQQEIRFPLWLHDHGFIKAAQGTTQERTIVLFEGPLFLTCFTNTADETQTEYTGILGPIEVEPVVSQQGSPARCCMLG